MTKQATPHRAEDRSAAPAEGRGLGLEQVGAAVQGIRFGEVKVIIQDGVIVQIERLEKQRLR